MTSVADRSTRHTSPSTGGYREAMRNLKRLLGLLGLGAVGYAVYKRTSRSDPAPTGSGTAQWAPLTPVSPPADTERSETASTERSETASTERSETASTERSETASTERRETASTNGLWVEPDDGGCPDSHPVKANADSGIYHVPGGASYVSTRAERCYCTAEDASADGFRAAKR